MPSTKQPTTHAAAKKTPAKKTPAKKTPAKKTPAKKTPAKTTPAKQTAATTTAAKRAPARKPASADYAGGPWAAAFAPRAPGERRYWLVKSEPDVFSFDDLLAAPGRTTHWDGVRNHAARNFLKDGMRRGDRVFYYHSMADPQAIVGICEVVREAYPDHTARDPASPYHDPAATADDPRWFMVDLAAVARLARPVTLAAIKARPELAAMALVRIGRLSVTPVTAAEWETIVAMGA